MEHLALKIVRFDSPEELDGAAAQWMAERMSKKDAVIGLATGSTPLGMYQEMVGLHQRGELDFSTVRTFNLDEYVGLSPADKQSYHYYMKENLFRYVNINKDRIHIPRGDAVDPQDEAARYAGLLRQWGPIDAQVLGIGTNGHIGFNEPGTSFESRTDVIKLAETTRRDNAIHFDTLEGVPTEAITVGIADILQSGEILLLAKGASKAEAIRRTVEENPTTDVPASVLQKHGRTTIFLDAGAASYLG